MNKTDINNNCVCLFSASLSWPLQNLGPFTLFVPINKGFKGTSVRITSDKLKHFNIYLLKNLSLILEVFYFISTRTLNEKQTLIEVFPVC